MSLWLCLRFQLLPLQALTRRDSGEQAPTAILEKQRVLQACDGALALGVKPGMGTATARALADNIRLLERDPAREQQCLQQLCCWAYSITPALYSYRQDCLLLEIGGCLTLFKGLERLLAQVRSDLSSRGYSYRDGLAETAKGAWLLSHKDESHRDMPRNDLHPPLPEQLAPLPLHLAEDFPQQVASLAKAGLWTFGDILSLSHRALARRCGKEFVHFLQQALGMAHDHQPEFQPPPTFSDDYWFGYEVKANQELLPAVQLLLQSLCQFLRNTQLQSQEVEWQLYGINRKIISLEVCCSLPHANWREWYQLTCLKVEQLQLDTAIEGVGLHCRQLDTGNSRTRDLFSPAEQREPLHSLLDRLQARLGLQSVEQIACRDEHLPEFAGYSSSDGGGRQTGRDAAANTAVPVGQRPFWLMPEPRALGASSHRLYWNGRLNLVEGPERIEDNWWLDAVSRDYYVARDRAGHQYWVFRDRLRNHWYIQGVFA
jgi:protein ImuB